MQPKLLDQSHAWYAHRYPNTLWTWRGKFVPTTLFSTPLPLSSPSASLSSWTLKTQPRRRVSFWRWMNLPLWGGCDLEATAPCYLGVGPDIRELNLCTPCMQPSSLQVSTTWYSQAKSAGRCTALHACKLSSHQAVLLILDSCEFAFGSRWKYHLPYLQLFVLTLSPIPAIETVLKETNTVPV